MIDCQSVRDRLANRAFSGDLRNVISESTFIYEENSDESDGHFFEVTMHDVARHRQDMLLNEKLIAHYLAQVAPVPFSEDFSYGSQIEEMLSNFVDRVPIDIRVMQDLVVRPYRDEIKLPGGPNKLKIDEIEILQFADVDGEAGAVGWVAHHEYVRSIYPNLGIRGLRARIGDLQVGEQDLFDGCFKEPRFNAWTIGEIHVLDRRIVPNRRRDNFELNHHAYNLITQLGPVATQITKRCRSASVARNSSLIIRNTIAQIEQRLADEGALGAAEVSRLRAAILRCHGKLKGVREIDANTLAAELRRLDERLAALPSTEQGSVVAIDEALALIAKYVTNREQGRRLADAIRKIAG
jgi:hypothetical protein